MSLFPSFAVYNIYHDGSSNINLLHKYVIFILLLISVCKTCDIFQHLNTIALPVDHQEPVQQVFNTLVHHREILLTWKSRLAVRRTKGVANKRGRGTAWKGAGQTLKRAWHKTSLRGRGTTAAATLFSLVTSTQIREKRVDYRQGPKVLAKFGAKDKLRLDNEKEQEEASLEQEIEEGGTEVWGMCHPRDWERRLQEDGPERAGAEVRGGDEGAGRGRRVQGPEKLKVYYRCW